MGSEPIFSSPDCDFIRAILQEIPLFLFMSGLFPADTDSGGGAARGTPAGAAGILEAAALLHFARKRLTRPGFIVNLFKKANRGEGRFYAQNR